MKKIMNKIDRFCYRHPRFGIPRLMLYIIGANILVWLVSQMDTTGYFLYYLEFNPALVCHGWVWQIFTFALVPQGSNILYIAIFLYFYYFIGNSLQQEWGDGKFTVYFFSGIVLTVVFGLLAYAVTGRGDIFVSAEYIYLSMFFAFATLWPDQKVLLFYIIPIKIKWLGILDAVFFLWAVVQNLLAGDIVAALIPVVATLNYLLFCGEWLAELVSPRRARSKARTIQFKQAAKKARAEQKNRPYTRKCAVCGRTDTDFPNLEFRYCSRCEGFHCFCVDHINNHIHFTE